MGDNNNNVKSAENPALPLIEIAKIGEKFERVKEDVDRHEIDLNGNGKVGIKQRLHDAEAEVANIKISCANCQAGILREIASIKKLTISLLKVLVIIAFLVFPKGSEHQLALILNIIGIAGGGGLVIKDFMQKKSKFGEKNED